MLGFVSRGGDSLRLAIAWLVLMWIRVLLVRGRIQGPANKEQPFASIIYTAVVRGKIALPCDIRPPSRDDSVTLVLWYKDETLSPIYTLDSRRGELEQAKQSSLPGLEDRAFFNMLNEPAFLQIDPVQEDDAGEYRCRVDFRKGRSINTVISLNVIVPPGDPVIVDENGYRLEGLVGRFNERDRLQLTCEVEGGKPRPAVSWWRDKRLVDSNYTVVRNGRAVRNVYEIPELQRSDFLSVLTCQATNSNLTVSVSRSITLDMNLTPSDVTIQPPKWPLSADKEVELVCTASGSRPPAVITWWKGGQQVISAEEHQLQEGVSTSSSVILFTPRVEDNGQVISCRAENEFIAGSAIEEGWKLDVFYTPKATVQLGQNLKWHDIQESNDVYLECLIDANPSATDVTWHFGDEEVTTNISEGVIVSGQSLVLQKVRRSWAGTYRCSAINEEGRGISNDFFLRVKFAPVCKVGQKSLYGVSPRESVRVQCELEADPNEVTFQWRFNSSSSSRAEDMVSYSHVLAQSAVMYSPLNEDDYGVLLCWGANEVGRQLRPCSFTVIRAGPPDAVCNCTQVNATEDAVSLECVEGIWDGGISPVTFLAELYDLESGQLRSNATSATSPSFTFLGLPGGASFRVDVYAVNSKGRKTPVHFLVSTLRPAEKLTAGSQAINIIRPVLGALVGTVITLLIAAVAIICLSRFRHQKKAKDHRNERNEKSQTLLTKDAEEFADFEERGPDIIPSTPLYKRQLEPGYTEGGDSDTRLTTGTLTTFCAPSAQSKGSAPDTTAAYRVLDSSKYNFQETEGVTRSSLCNSRVSPSPQSAQASSTLQILRNVPIKLPQTQFPEIDFPRTTLQRPLPPSHQIPGSTPGTVGGEDGLMPTSLCGIEFVYGSHMESTV